MADLATTIGIIINELSDLKSNLKTLEDIDNRIRVSNAKLTSTEEALDSVRKEHEQNQAALLQSIKQNEEAVFTKVKELEDVTAHLNSQKQKLTELEVLIASKVEQHQQIEASLNSLRQKLV